MPPPITSAVSLPTVQAVFSLLAGAYQCAALSKRAPEEFAVPASLLLRTGIAHTDLGALLDGGYIAYRVGTGIAQEGPTARPDGCNPWVAHAEIVLTAKGSAEMAGLVAHDAAASLPRWSAAERMLSLHGQPIKHFERCARIQTTVLDEFERLCWPTFIGNPLGAKGDARTRRCLENAVKSLNRRLLRPSIRFVLSADGDSVGWHLVPGAAAQYTDNAPECYAAVVLQSS
jgi:hypothetical protein